MPTANQSTAVATRREGLDLITHELELRADALLEVLPPGMDPKRFMRVSLLAISKNPDLLTCTPTSIIGSIIEAAEVGLEPTGSLNRAWLVPFKPKDKPKEAQLMIGYQGYADLMRDSGRIQRITAEVVYEGDTFAVTKGSNPEVIHEPAFATEDPTKITHAYAIAWFSDGGQQFEVMTRAQIELVRAKSRMSNGPAWTQGYGQMCRKSVLRRLSNYTPLSSRAVSAIARDDEREFGGPPEAATSHPQTAGGSRTAQAREAVKARLTGEPSGGAETTVSSSTESAEQQRDAADQTECGTGSDPDLGDVDVCVLAPGHQNPDGKPSPHKAANGTVFPNVAPPT